MMQPLQRWMLWLVGLGAGYMVLAKPEAVYKLGQTFRSVTAGSIRDVTRA